MQVDVTNHVITENNKMNCVGDGHHFGQIIFFPFFNLICFWYKLIIVISVSIGY